MKTIKDIMREHRLAAVKPLPAKLDDEPGFTPGPWEANIGGGGCNVMVNSTMLAPIIIPINPDWLLTHPHLVEEAEANARLIARAPAIYAENQRLRAALLVVLELDTPSEDMGGDWGTTEWCEGVGQVIEQAREALAGDGGGK